MDIYRIDPSDPEGVIKFLEKVLGPNPDEDFANDLLLVKTYRRIQNRIQDLVEMVYVMTGCIETNPNPSELFDSFDPRQLRMALSDLFDAYEHILAATNTAGNPYLVDEQMKILDSIRKTREGMLG